MHKKANKTRDFEKNKYPKYGKNSLNTEAPDNIKSSDLNHSESI